MTRIRLLMLVIGFVLHGAAVVRAADEARRLNILFCFADDWGRYAGAYAPHDRGPSPNSVVRTPHIDRMAREGVLFRNAFVPAPSCTPCRSSLLSGRYFFRTGRASILQGAQWDSSIPAFPLLLEQAGYRLGKSAKVWSPGAPADAPIGGQAHAYQQSGMRHNNFSEEVTKGVAAGSTVAAAREALLDEVRGNFRSFLADQRPETPWFFWFGPTTVHRTWVRGSGKALWGIEPDDLRGKLPRFLPDVPELREDFADYLGEAQAFDAYIGALREVLEQQGELDRTLIVISGDHGAPGFPRGKCNLYDFGVAVALVARWPGAAGERVVDDFVNLMDLAPTFLEIGGAKAPEDWNGRSIERALREGQGQVDPEMTFVVTGRERHVAAAREDHRPYPHRALRTGEFLYIRNFAPDRWPMGSPLGVTDDSTPPHQALVNNTFVAFPDMDAGPAKAWLVEHRQDPQWAEHYQYAFGKRPAEELYDLRSDPHQLHNVAGEARYQQDRARLAEQLTKVLRDAGDPRLEPDGGMFERPPFTDPVGNR